MELTDTTFPAQITKDGNELLLVAGKRLKITTGTDEVLNWNIPAGETWKIYIQINATKVEA